MMKRNDTDLAWTDSGLGVFFFFFCLLSLVWDYLICSWLFILLHTQVDGIKLHGIGFWNRNFLCFLSFALFSSSLKRSYVKYYHVLGNHNVSFL